MALRLNRSVIRGDIDNRYRGRVTATLWLVGRQEPIQLDLRGNCLRDLAGHRVCFENTADGLTAAPDDLASVQTGRTGNMTASRRIRTLGVTPYEARELRKAGKRIPQVLTNRLYIEWFSEETGRVVVELSDFRITQTESSDWRMTREEEASQVEQNREAIRDYIARKEREREAGAEPWDGEVAAPLDEFAWEEKLKESDALTERYSEVFERYADHPEGEKLIAREMGWEWLDDALDADERGAFDDEKQGMEEIPPLEPDPKTEGVDWIRTRDNNIKHPLSHRAFETAMDMWHRCKDRGLLEEDGDPHLFDMLFQAQTLGAKLAGALDNLPYDTDPEAGFIIACLKRSLQFFDKAVAASREVERKRTIPPGEVVAFRKQLFEIREEILTLMARFRAQL